MIPNVIIITLKLCILFYKWQGTQVVSFNRKGFYQSTKNSWVLEINPVIIDIRVRYKAKIGDWNLITDVVKRKIWRAELK